MIDLSNIRTNARNVRSQAGENKDGRVPSQHVPILIV
jgi:hypothetical protein